MSGKDRAPFDEFMSINRKAKRNYTNLTERKAWAAKQILASDLWSRAEDGADVFEPLYGTWLSMVGDHKSDMGCGIVAHMCHTHDLVQLRLALERMAGKKH